VKEVEHTMRQAHGKTGAQIAMQGTRSHELLRPVGAIPSACRNPDIRQRPRSRKRALTVLRSVQIVEKVVHHHISPAMRAHGKTGRSNRYCKGQVQG
jgi:hypothetical protein